MDREVIEQKLESLRQRVRCIETKCPADSQILVTDPDLQDIIAAKNHRVGFSEFARVRIVALECT